MCVLSLKFILLLARLAEGDLKTEIAIKTLGKEWNRMTAVMGMPFNRFSPLMHETMIGLNPRKRGTTTYVQGG
jgi:hypothetical protein